MADPPCCTRPPKRGRPSEGEPPLSAPEQLYAEVAARVEGLTVPAQRKEFVELLRGLVEYYSCCGAEQDQHEGAPSRKSGMATLERIQREIRASVPPDGLAPGERICFPPVGQFQDCTEVNTAHVDSFLYGDEDLVDHMCEEGKLSRHYCCSPLCGYSREVRPLQFISHSFSTVQLQFVFTEALRGVELSEKTVVDVGSRLGAVLYYGALMTPTKALVGVELNPFFVNLQRRMVKKHKLEPRVSVVEADVFSESGMAVLATADVVILNNVFEWFTAEDPQRCFERVRQALRPGTRVVANPSLEVSLSTSSRKDFAALRLKKVSVEHPRTPGLGPEDEEPCEEFEAVQGIHCYVAL
eukprot:RCo026913